MIVAATALPARKRPTVKALFMATLFGAAGAGIGYLFGKSAAGMPWLRQHFESLGTPDLLLLPVLILAVLATHEVGHLLGGFSRGMRFLLLIVGPFQWTRSPAGIRFKWVFNLGTMGGIAAATPDPSAPLAPQLKRLIIGGPLASLVLAVVGLALALGFEGRAGAYGVIIGAMSLLIFLVTATPLRAGGFMSDGMQYLELRRGGAAVTERQVLLRLMGVSYAGVRPRDWEPQLVKDALAMQEAEPLRRVAGRIFALYHAMDRGDGGRACTSTPTGSRSTSTTIRTASANRSRWNCAWSHPSEATWRRPASGGSAAAVAWWMPRVARWRRRVSRRSRVTRRDSNVRWWPGAAPCRAAWIRASTK